MGRNNRYKDCKNSNSLFKRRARCCRVVGSKSPYCYRNRAEITVRKREQKPSPVWFSCGRQSLPVKCEHSLKLKYRELLIDSKTSTTTSTRFPQYLVLSARAWTSLIRDLKIQRRDGDKKVAEKVNLRSFSLYSDYSWPLTLSNVGEPSWSWISRDKFKLRKRNKISSLLVYVRHKTRNQAFSRRSRAKTGKKCTKKCDARAKWSFCLLNLLFFSTFSLSSASLDLNVPILAGKRGSRLHSTTSFSANVEVVETIYQMLEVLSLCDRERV